MSHKSGPPQKKLKTEAPADSKSNDEKMQQYVEDIEKVQQKLEKIEEEKASEILKLEKTFADKMRPHFKERNDILKKIPSFWKDTFLSHPVLAECFNETDEKILDAIEELDIEEMDEGGWKITMKFKSNPFFKNTSLVKELKYNKDEEPTVTQTEIQWKDPKKHEDGFFVMWFKKESDQSAISEHIEVGDILKNEIWPDPVKIFFGEGPDFVDEDEEGEGEEDDE